MALIAFLLSAIIFLGCSTTYHHFYCLSENVNKVLIRLDYAGICFLVSGSTFAPLFMDSNAIQHMQSYMPVYKAFLASFSLAFVCLISSILQNGDPQKTNYLQDLDLRVPFHSFILQSLLIIIALLCCYGHLIFVLKRFPEKKNPGKFDNCGQSHQIWHISVVIAILFTYVGSLNAYYQRLDMPCKA
ncbi:unnamed protein product (macronuclear) [Paramecium tetraurelia]|uniref:Uncharacterized protein n=1 Tax=Paramecium tetraurelia TaxID=5888 RepID=A0CHV6_PARTE|nr:uncharacterized protein GSPATT00038475001 [Paramecium tetraurelia]CAK70373.1 unnamed protein product [Paramecium tetraurelia]|eukprot:XP_001437770.1 hypothetical protein (macronuclear) [Paramecium tetraurelia strain d4-2]